MSVVRILLIDENCTLVSLFTRANVLSAPIEGWR